MMIKYAVVKKQANSVDHYLDDCPRTKSLKRKFKKKLMHQSSKQKQEIIKDEKLTEFLAQMVEEINKII
ncbi:hypothetical protein HPB48_009775 [Haemaphysalis longicornis]|uniref:Uncharacterized protein n=1 Tax=Haemaphysalis longicornis TaxID=44386 RepID=A0A9J6GNB7_HAELO|nr:hypothetical protein HPB48_009775 [Haemaphysalis longicornis]